MGRSVTRRVPRATAAGIALLASLGLLLAPVASPRVAAAEEADDGLSLISNATYTLVPDQGLVHVSVGVTASNTKPNLVRETPTGSVTTRYFFESASLAIHAEATNVTAAAAGTALRTRLTPEDGFTIARVDFPSDLYVDQSLTFSVDFDLPGGEPRSDSDIRVGSAFATFYAWAFGDSGDVTINVPGGFDVEASGSPTRETAADGVTTIAATGISDVVDWYAIVVADRPDALTQERLDLADGERLVIRAWPEDELWRERVGGLLEIGLPVLADKVGLPWPVEGDIEVTEVHTPLLEGYAGVFIPSEDRIEISEDLDELTIMHEAAHAWFNEDLFVGRWIGEGLADEYASRVLDEVSIGGLAPDPVGRTSPGAIALNDWQAPGRIADDETQARETYGYEASWAVVRALIREVGEDGLRKVLAAADEKRIAYVGAGTPETLTGSNDWRRLLDLLEEDGGSAKATSVFRQTIVTEEEKPLLDERAEARAAYAALEDAGDGWLPGFAIRDPMSRWEFPRAEAMIDDAAEVLETREEVEDGAADLGLTPPPTLREAYEGAQADYASVRELADRLVATESELSDARERVDEERPPLTLLGLVGDDPDGTLEAARAAFSEGDLDAANEDLASVDAMLDGAIETGRQRFASVVAILLGVSAIAGLTVALVRTGRRGAAVTLGDPRPADPAPNEQASVDREGGDAS
jgi:hypothetical protein